MKTNGHGQHVLVVCTPNRYGSKEILEIFQYRQPHHLAGCNEGMIQSRHLSFGMVTKEQGVLTFLCPSANYVGIIVEKARSTVHIHQ